MSQDHAERPRPDEGAGAPSPSENGAPAWVAPPPGSPPWGAPPVEPAWAAPAAEPAWGVPPVPPPSGLTGPRRRKSGRTKTLGAIGAAAAVAIGGAIAVSAAGTSGAQSPGSTTSTSRPTVPGAAGDRAEPGGGTRGAMGAFALLRNALHGDFVVAADHSTGNSTVTSTERLQRGAVTAQSGTSLTVRSTDGYSSSYTVPSGLDLTGISTGTNVLVIATLNGSTATVVSVIALTAGTAGGVPGPGDGFGPGGARPGAPDGTGNSGRSGSGATTASTANTA